MQYMHFNSSCSFCGVANLLELQGREITDEELFRAMRADVLLHHEEKDGHWQTGAMLQSSAWFDLALKPMGFRLEEHTASAEEIISILPPPFMVGLRIAGRGRHAMLLLEREKNTLIFLNPHREGDGEENTITFSPAACAERLEPASMVGCLAASDALQVDFLPYLKKALDNWLRYQEELIDYTGKCHAADEIHSKMDSLFRPLLLDALEGARICGYRVQEERLRKLQRQFLNCLKRGEPVRLSECLAEEELFASFDFYRSRLETLISEEERQR